MCGIFGFVSGANVARGVAPERLFDAVAGLTAFDAQTARTRVPDMAEAEQREVLERLRLAHDAVYSWICRAAFLQVLSDDALRARLGDVGRRLDSWVRRLQEATRGAHFGRQRDWEFVNQLVVGGQDIVWQLERDLLGNLEPVRDLVAGEAPAGDGVLSFAWQLNLMLSSLNRLEVRGRDSAGVAAYVRFPDAAALDGFLDGRGDGTRWRARLREREALVPRLTNGAVVRPQTSAATLLFAFKVAEEMGRMGDNVAALRASIRGDALFQAALACPGVDMQCLAHTRWASNGVISQPNCHPVDSAVVAPGSNALRGAGEIVAALNGDIDNYQELAEVYLAQRGLRFDETITTDAKIIPVMVHHHYAQTGDLGEAFRMAFAEFEGSMAIGVMSADRPGEYVFGQKGGGQGLFFGIDSGCMVIASEMYGIVEFTQRYVKAEGDQVAGGEVYHVDARDGAAVELHLATPGGRRALPPERLRRAEITTRDINRGQHPHFFLKEIVESVDSVRKTLRGKFETDGGSVRTTFGAELFPPALLGPLRAGRIRRLFVVGQGTAAVAAEGVAHLLRRALERWNQPLEIVSLKATELSGHHMEPDMSDSLVLAISQSGTTTDTNRTVGMARERGAWILGIVNRRNSDLVYKCHGVLYTSDGRDIEMSVASTKAFYAQNVAGQILALGLALELGTLSPDEVRERLAQLEELPELMARTLGLADQIRDLAERFAPRRRHWALVGSGASKIAADELRIKLSELCYKSIAVDFLEDKKHIDLSSEPLILVCANGVPPATLSDIVKEVAIFKAHNSLPIVITDEGEERFEPYARGTIKVPRSAGPLSYLLATIAGHLFGYHAAVAFDRRADRLRALRSTVLRAAQPAAGRDGGAAPAGPEALDALPEAATRQVVELAEMLASGELDSALNASTATRLSATLGFLLGRIPADAVRRDQPTLADTLLASLTGAINELARPIDAIKHQAKTVTVGISRGEVPVGAGALWDVFLGFHLPAERLVESHQRFLGVLAPLVSRVAGATLYAVEGLDPLGRPVEGSTIRVLDKLGAARELTSRNEATHALSGTKWGVVKRREIFLGFGRTDGRRILIVPVIGEHETGRLLLYHLSLVPQGRRELRLQALKACGNQLDAIRVAVTEQNLEWDPLLLDLVDNDTLFFDSPERIAAEILTRSKSQSQPQVS